MFSWKPLHLSGGLDTRQNNTSMYSYCAKADISIGQAAVPFPETSVSDSVAKVKLDIFGEKVMSCSRLHVIGGSLSGLLLMAAMCGARAEAQATARKSTRLNSSH